MLSYLSSPLERVHSFCFIESRYPKIPVLCLVWHVVDVRLSCGSLQIPWRSSQGKPTRSLSLVPGVFVHCSGGCPRPGGVHVGRLLHGILFYTILYCFILLYYIATGFILFSYLLLYDVLLNYTDTTKDYGI